MTERSRLRWLCRRGMKELDLVMTSFLDNDYESAPSELQKTFVHLLNRQDPEIYALLLDRMDCENDNEKFIIEKLRSIKTRKPIVNGL